MTGARLHSKGFTLLELLAAMALMVVVAGCLYTALYTGFRAHRSALSAVSPTAQAMDAIELLKQDIYGVLPPTGVLAGAFVGTDQRGFKGADTDILEFYTTQVYASRDEIVGGIGKIELGLEEDLGYDLIDGRQITRTRIDTVPDTYKLVRKVTSNLLSPKTIDPNEQVLCRNVVSLNLRYFDGTSWIDEWDSVEDANSLPLAVEIEIHVVDDVRSRNVKSTVTSASELPQRQLIQSFPIPCGLTALTEEELAELSGEGG
ncbi:MAG: prepilin-type N-terminal cleavage/methylation domain-containing protein [Sedimentisphaerales bacterium]|nr:prepilin-type N-terminal cleavage/methylation domain-containing protein [Sedimentisphaerales bacterium]